MTIKEQPGRFSAITWSSKSRLYSLSTWTSKMNRLRRLKQLQNRSHWRDQGLYLQGRKRELDLSKIIRKQRYQKRNMPNWVELRVRNKNLWPNRPPVLKISCHFLERSEPDFLPKNYICTRKLPDFSESYVIFLHILIILPVNVIVPNII